MTGTFSQEYVAVYDLLYGGKDYTNEATFVLERLKAAVADPSSIKTLLDIGCGTGRHAQLMAAQGTTVQGVDLSDKMVALASERAAGTPVAEAVSFTQGDVRDFRFGKTFESAAALFHVFSYLTATEGLEQGMQTVRAHLPAGAPFLFDYWYGEAIRRDGVERREREAENDAWHVNRVTEPVWEKDKDLVRVNFHVTATNKATNTVHKWHEEHPMRYFDPDFLQEKLEKNGFRVAEHGEWLTGGPPQAGALGAYVVAVAV